jgi:hypothetical protein
MNTHLVAIRMLGGVRHELVDAYLLFLQITREERIVVAYDLVKQEEARQRGAAHLVFVDEVVNSHDVLALFPLNTSACAACELPAADLRHIRRNLVYQLSQGVKRVVILSYSQLI